MHDVRSIKAREQTHAADFRHERHCRTCWSCRFLRGFRHACPGDDFFPPRLIYVAAGAADWINPVVVSTVVGCTNLSGQNATVRWSFFKGDNGSLLGSLAQVVPHARTVFVRTHNGLGFYGGLNVSTAEEFDGMVIVYSTQSAVFCSAVVANPPASELQVDLHMVRFNPHPGTVE